MSNHLICAVVVTYNRLELLKECLTAITASREVSHVVVVNNNSSDGTKDFLATLDPAKFLITNSTENLGGAGGFAMGITKAYQQTDDNYFWIMDDDTIPQPGAAKALVEKAVLLNDQFGFLASDVRWRDGHSSNMPGPTIDWPERIQDGLVKVMKGTFVSVLFTREMVKKVGIPTKELFLWGDDTEYTERVTQRMPSYFVIDSPVIHKSPSNLTDISIMNDSADRIPRYFYLYRNLVYISKCYQSKGAALKLAIRQLLSVLSVLSHAKDHRFKRSGAIIRGSFAGIFFNPPVVRV